jgi:hypothetical protein
MIYQIAQESGQSVSAELVQTVSIKLEEQAIKFVDTIRLDSDFAHTTAVVSKRFE